MKFALLILSITFLPGSLKSQYLNNWNHESGIALKGYDAVAYHSLQKANIGKPAFKFAYKGLVWQFSSLENLELFKKDPSRYEPAYGGWCAYAMGAEGKKVDIDPKTFKLINGRLYLFYNRYFNNTLISWNEQEVSLKQKADHNWNRFSAQ